MPARTATENLSFAAPHAAHGLTGLFLRLEDWLAERASARALYRMDDSTLSDLGLSRSDVERINHSLGRRFRRRS
jgi:uncharacterized protein YjiS (DUF1127 family)